MLIGKNIILRSLRISDADFLNKWRNHIENKIMTQGYRFPIPLPKDEEWLKSKMMNSSSNEVFFIVEELNNPIGLIQLANIDFISGIATWQLLGKKTVGEKVIV